MTPMQITLIILVILLSAYVIYLHVQLSKKNIFIESIVKRLTGMEKEWKMDEIKKFLSELHRFSFRSTFFEDRLFEEKSLDFILGNEKDSRIYIHYTREESDAKNILRQGFKFVDSFYKTALPITNDRLDLLIKHNNRKYFGDYLIVICISDKIVKSYSSELEKANIKSYSFENVLTENPPFKNDNSDLEYLLPKQFIKGYLQHRTGEIVLNSEFDPRFSSPGFKMNIETLINKQ
jgi:hypothetical protein